MLVVYKQKLDSVGRRSVSFELGSISHQGGEERIDRAVRLHVAKPATTKTKMDNLSYLNCIHADGFRGMWWRIPGLKGDVNE